MDQHLFLAIVFTVIVKIDSARILAVFPTPSISHQIVFRPLTQELVKRGHEVVVITTDLAFPSGKAHVNLTEIDTHNVTYDIWKKEFLSAVVGKPNDMYKQVKALIDVCIVLFENQLQIESVKDIVENKSNATFDLLLLETCIRPALAFSYVYKVPVISISSFGPSLGIYDKLGMPSHPLLYPTFKNQRLYNLSYWEKIKELFYHYLFEYTFFAYEHYENEVLKKYFGPDIPPLSQLYKNVDMFFQNIHPLLLNNPPVPPNIIYLGGMHQKPAKPLPQELSLYLNNSKNGVVYVSFGSNVKLSLLPKEKVQMMINVFSKLPYDVLWKTDTNDFFGISRNVKVSSWFPQADLLRHPKIKVFITQGGQQSTDEAITAGVPLIGIPMYADQWFIVEKYVCHKIGLQLYWDSLTQEEFMNAILTVTEDTSYRENMKRFSNIIKDQPQPPLERAIWWTEYLLRHGGAKHMRASAANMSWAEYYELNLIIILVTSLIVALFSLLLLIKLTWINMLKFYKSVKVKMS